MFQSLAALIKNNLPPKQDCLILGIERCEACKDQRQGGAWPSRRARWPTRREALPGPRPLILFNLSCRRLRRVRTLGELSGDPSDSLVGQGAAGTDVRRPAPRERVWRRRLPARTDADCARGGGEALRLLPASGELCRAYSAATSSRGFPPPPPWCVSRLLILDPSGSLSPCGWRTCLGLPVRGLPAGVSCCRD
ncbi:hypothetical protein NDU88_003540 [Pleurodeles waltl]|uniref:Uncharacterized protein n=1 Tax=Pleurodeles waltl TaxID=8319 RepID=A0AAV7WVL7_PLEWA|nr:hypothetical protein NDU88_003540 [Pleurodeles waltl]